MRYSKLLIVITIFIVLSACQNKGEIKATGESSFVGHKVTVVEAIDGKTYTYLRVAENGNEHWIAITKRETKIGEILYYVNSLKMPNFESKELGRTFETIGFVSKISDKPNQNGGMMNSGKAGSTKPESSKAELSIEVAKDGITIAELYSNLDSYNGKAVIMRGKVTKFNSEIMNRNWVHIQDGTGDSANFDLTITTLENVKVGDIITFKGTIAVSKDFGAGYFYEVIMESATVVD